MTRSSFSDRSKAVSNASPGLSNSASTSRPLLINKVSIHNLSFILRPLFHFVNLPSV
nr:MAG TPA: hypothetical protein [Caudoviricetes sp.]